MIDKLIGYWKPLLAVIFWGASFIATKIALNELSPMAIILLRLVFAIVLLVLFSLYKKESFTLKPRIHGWIFILALVAVFHLWIQVTGLKYTSASNTGWIVGLSPVFMAILGILFFKEFLRLIQTFGILIAFLGLVLLISKADFSNLNFISNKGDFMVLASSFTWSLYSIINKRIAIDYSPMLTTLFLFVFMALLISPFVINSAVVLAILHLSLRSWISIVFLGIFCSGIAYVLWAQSLKEMESAKVGAFLYFEPFITVFTAWLFLKEVITPLMLLSGFIITLGVVLVNSKKLSLKRS
ncbi:MAG: DMT family transporter [Bacteroidota bacterium]|nr:DMT family transporter [Bacteroidota bacterium]MDP4194587.1 DMT family transporter [Bacteroidota bacterium]